MIDRACTIISATIVTLSLLFVVGYMTPKAVRKAQEDIRLYQHLNVGN